MEIGNWRLGRTGSALVGLIVAASVAQAAPTFTKKPVVVKKDGGFEISFAVSEKTDVEVAILDKDGKVARHLAAGVLGAETPPPSPLKPGLSQVLVWDGRDDYGAPLTPNTQHPTPLSVRVRAAMRPKLERIVGGDLYAYLSDDMNQGNHTVWKMTGLV